MTGWMVDTKNVRNIVSNFDGQYRSIGDVRSSVREIRNHCAVSGQSKAAIQGVLDRIMVSMEKDEKSIRKMGTTLWEAAALYEDCEKRIVGNGAKQASGAGKKEEKAEEKKQGLTWKWSDTWKVISKAGIIGAGTSAIGNLVTGDGDVKTLLSSMKFMTDAIGGGGAAVAAGGSGAAWFQYMTGMNNAMSGLDLSSFGKTFTSSMSKQFKNLDFTGASTTADKVKVGAKWAGYAMTALIQGFENYDEYKRGEISAGRAVAEWGIETGVEIGLNMGATALVTAGLAAAGVTAGLAASAVVVGAAAVVVVWGANGICKWATGGKDIGEVVADGICDVGEKAVSVAKNVGKNVKKAGKAVLNSFSKIGTRWSHAFA